ncbi:hypothetical protein SmJEL517_g00237 [Synchytrium microbalum]|uniref:NADH:flavin oxidoreductase/NADH oxidase N-terminal domain-containing protein n=1 Tax=Synchytrium microbalum TaxID=1806994 RepID=A0A507CJQ1_9FUNG|nr:uncharacterized protein SmJEL517_g00237 [Synchytrium microbalum]TPX37993.1 hypothetical protein SmJEL517_g00237 [Synchytrium microbalum]
MSRSNSYIQSILNHLADSNEPESNNCTAVSPCLVQSGIPRILTPLKLGGDQPLTLNHRIVMASMARHRVELDGTIKAQHVGDYYVQRSTPGGLILSEATAISAEGVVSLRAPGIYTQSHIDAWRTVVARVKETNAVFFMQLWHGGRASHSAFQPDNQLPVSSSPVAISGTVMLPKKGAIPFETPRELTTEEAYDRAREYGRAAQRAKDAGFDGVEIHGANGYLVDQFLQSTTNQRTDEYGGSVENRCKFALLCVEECIKVYGSSRVGIRLAPHGAQAGIADANPVETWTCLLRMLLPYNLAYVVEPKDFNGPNLDPYLKTYRNGGGVVITCGAYTPATAVQHVDTDTSDAIAFARLFISNPDLVERIKTGRPLQQYESSLFYSAHWNGYSNYPTFSTDPEMKEWGKWTSYRGTSSPRASIYKSK